MVPREEYAMVSQDTTLAEAVAVLMTHRSDETIKYHHRAVLVVNEENRVVGKLSMHDIIRALEPGYREVQEFDHSRRFGFGMKFIKTMVKDYNLWQRPMDDLCQKATGTRVKKIMYTPEEGEYVSIDATFNEAVHQLVVGHHQSLLVVGPDRRVKGVLRLTDVFQEVAERMKPCEE
jgi:CBS domain-containing protein